MHQYDPFAANGRISFFAAEVRTGLIFSTIALRTGRIEVRLRNIANTRRVYEVILYFLNKTVLTREELAELEPSLDELRLNLVRLDALPNHPIRRKRNYIAQGRH